jgi:DNA-binding HxlR family transcriptional regulator
MVRSVDGLTTKVLNQCLRRNIDFGILVKKSYPEIPPRVEYEASDFGIKFMAILDSLEAIQQEFDINDSASAP